MSIPNFKDDNEKRAYFSLLESIYNAIHSYENQGETLEVNDDNLEGIQEDLQNDFKNGHLIYGNGTSIEEGKEPYDLFSLFISGAKEKDYAPEKNSFFFRSAGNDTDRNFYSMTVDNKGANISQKPVDPDKMLTLQVNAENKKDMDKFGEFAQELKTAAKSTSRDSGEYKEIISMLEGFNKAGVDFSSASSKVAADWRKLDKNQRLALPMVLLKEKIDKYLEHKAKDGIKQNTFHKLAAVEKLNQYLGERIGQIQPEKFSFNRKTYTPEVYKKGPGEEFLAVNKVRKAEGKEELPYHGLGDYDLRDAVVSSMTNLRRAGKNRDLYDVNEIGNVGRCMNRIIMKAQINYDGKQRDELVDKLKSTRQAFIDNPLEKIQKTAKSEKSAEQNSRNI